VIEIFIVGRQPLFQQGIRASLSQTPDIEVLGGIDNGEMLLSAIEDSPPDVLLLDIDAPSFSGLELCRTINRHLPSIAIIILTPHPDDKQLFQAIQARASAYLGKEVSADALAETIRRCAQGEHPINESLTSRPKVAEQILQQFYQLSQEKEAAGYVSPLTPRETEVLNYVAQGYLNKQIAEALNVSEQTVKNHITSILRKFNVNARTQAVVLAIKKGLVSINKE
jgi:DNA-binding NarL/FixJ family response regulator